MFQNELKKTILIFFNKKAVGLSIGPLFASYLYYIGGYKAPFLFFSVFIFLLLFYVREMEIIDKPVENEENFFTKLFYPVNNKKKFLYIFF